MRSVRGFVMKASLDDFVDGDGRYVSIDKKGPAHSQHAVPVTVLWSEERKS